MFGGVIAILLVSAVGYALLAGNTPKESAHVTTDATPQTIETVTPPLPDGKSNLQFEVFPDAMGNTIEGSVIQSPLALSGRARGTWYFEASFPIELRDDTGKTLAVAIATAQSDWMTEDFVDWTATMTWSATSTTATSGVLIFKKDNPSGLPEHDASIEMSVLLK